MKKKTKNTRRDSWPGICLEFQTSLYYKQFELSLSPLDPHVFSSSPISSVICFQSPPAIFILLSLSPPQLPLRHHTEVFVLSSPRLNTRSSWPFQSPSCPPFIQNECRVIIPDTDPRGPSGRRLEPNRRPHRDGRSKQNRRNSRRRPQLGITSSVPGACCKRVELAVPSCAAVSSNATRRYPGRRRPGIRCDCCGPPALASHRASSGQKANQLNKIHLYYFFCPPIFVYYYCLLKKKMKTTKQTSLISTISTKLQHYSSIVNNDKNLLSNEPYFFPLPYIFLYIYIS